MNRPFHPVLSALRRSLGVVGTEPERQRMVTQRLQTAPAVGIIPARGDLNAEKRSALFCEMAKLSMATYAHVTIIDDIPQAIADYLRSLNLPPRVRRGADPRLEAFRWDTTTLEISVGASEGNDLTAVSHALGGVAETGTVVLTSGPDNPSTLNMLPDNHIVIVDAEDIVGSYEAMWQRIRAIHGKGQMPRSVNWITGPSRSGDIEQTILLGAHGPRRLHIVVVERD